MPLILHILLRTALEDAALQTELPGYRLIPGIH
jgi:hypothetical protein